jgi:hypothetical protein
MDQLPPVIKCDVMNCFYNTSKACHAPAINVGGDHPSCDTFVARATHIARQGPSMVGACHVSTCRHNQDMMCSASGISVTGHEGHADCATFEKR